MEIPNFGSRYYTFSRNPADLSSDKSPGNALMGEQIPTLFITGSNKGISVPDGMETIISPTRYFHISGRILVDNENDLTEVYELQKQIKLCTYEDNCAGIDRKAPISKQRLLNEGCKKGDKFTFLYQLGNVLKDWWGRDHEKSIINRFSFIGLTIKGFNVTVLSDEQKEEVFCGLEKAKEIVDKKSKNLGSNINGWTINYLCPRFGEDYLLRAAVAKDQIYVAIPEEAIYPVGRVDSTGKALTGENPIRLFLLRIHCHL